MRTHTTLLDTTWAEPCAGPCCRAERPVDASWSKDRPAESCPLLELSDSAVQKGAGDRRDPAPGH